MMLLSDKMKVKSTLLSKYVRTVSIDYEGAKRNMAAEPHKILYMIVVINTIKCNLELFNVDRPGGCSFAISQKQHP